MARTERTVEDRLVHACRKIGIRCPKGLSAENTGFPDRIVFNTIIREIHYVEIKNKTYYQRTQRQIEWSEIIIQCGGKYFLIDGKQQMDDYIAKYIKRPTNE